MSGRRAARDILQFWRGDFGRDPYRKYDTFLPEQASHILLQIFVRLWIPVLNSHRTWLRNPLPIRRTVKLVQSRFAVYVGLAA